MRSKYLLSAAIFTLLITHPFLVFSKLNDLAEVKFTQEDRDNIKKTLLMLEMQQKQIEDFKYYTNQRFDSQDKRFDSQESRFDSQDKRLDNIWSLILVLIATSMGSVAYMYWDRREANRPLKEKLEMQEKEIGQLKNQVMELMNKAAML